MNRATLSRLPKGAKPLPASPVARAYPLLIEDIAGLLETARRASARAVNALMTATYWEVGRRIVEFEQHGGKRARYGEALLKRLAQDLSARAGKGFSRQNLQNMRSFYLTAPPDQICQTLSGKLPAPQNSQTVSGESNPKDAGIPAPSALPFALSDLARAFPLPWSHYVLLVSRSRSPEAFVFYQSEALRGGWSVRQSAALVRYATEGLADKLLVRDYLTLLPEEKTLATELEKTRAALQSGQSINL